MSTQDSKNSGDPSDLGEDLSVGIVPNKSAGLKSTDTRQDTFCKAYERLGTVTAACKVAKIDRSTIHAWANTDAYGFKSKFADAKSAHADYLESILFDRIENKPNSDVLVMFALNGAKPEKYKNPQATNEQASEVIAKLTRLTRKSVSGQEETVEIAEVRG
jgi:hypothetical protein